MKQQEILKKIGIIIKELQEQYQFIDDAQGPVNDLELELFVANGHFLGDHIEILRKINAKQLKDQAELDTHISQKYFEPVVQPAPVYAPIVKEDPPAKYVVELSVEPAKVTPPQEPVIKHELSFDNIDMGDEGEERDNFDDMDVTGDHAYPSAIPHFTPFAFTPAEPEPVINYPEPEPEVTHAKWEPETWHTEPETEQPKPEPDPVINYPEPKPEVVYTKPEPEIIKAAAPAPVASDTEKKLTVNQMISAQLAGTTRVADQLPPVKDLKSAININDKMLFVKDLFNGYSLSYSEAIDILNRAETFDEADIFLTINYAAKNNWEAKQATVDKFYTLLHRRFA